jgi:hypothetical protein
MVTIGHVIAPGDWQWKIYFVVMLGVAFIVLASYRINELHDRTTATCIPRRDHKLIAIILFADAIACSMYLACEQGWWVLLLAAIGGTVTVAYNLNVVHNKAVYGFIWGGGPLVFSAMTQAGNPAVEIPYLFMGAWACVVAVYTLWLWGPTTCGRVMVCARAKGEIADRLCHSPTLRCKDRLVMPKEVHEHMKVLVDLNVIAMLILTIAIVSL